MPKKDARIHLDENLLMLLIQTGYALMEQDLRQIVLLDNGEFLATVTMTGSDSASTIAGSSFSADFGQGRILEYDAVEYDENSTIH